MPTFTFRRVGVCSGGNHHTIEVSDGTNTRQLHVDTNELRKGIDEDELVATFKVLARSSLRGLTVQQAATNIFRQEVDRVTTTVMLRLFENDFRFRLERGR